MEHIEFSLVCGRCGAEHPPASITEARAGVCRDCGATLKTSTAAEESQTSGLGALAEHLARERSKGSAGRSRGSVVSPPTHARVVAATEPCGEQDFDARIGPLLKKSNSEPPRPERRALARTSTKKWGALLAALTLGVAAAFGLEFAILGHAPAPRSTTSTPLNAPARAAPPVLAIERALAAPSEALDNPPALGEPPVLERAAPALAATVNDVLRAERSAKVELDRAAPEPSAEPEAPALAAFDAKEVERAIEAAARRAQSCKQPGAAQGAAVVTITFAPSGRATTATVSGEPFAGTSTGGCIAAKLREVRVPPFSGEFITVKKTVPID